MVFACLEALPLLNGLGQQVALYLHALWFPLHLRTPTALGVRELCRIFFRRKLVS